MMEMKKILFPCDLSVNTSKIVPYVLSLSEPYDSEIFVLHVVQDLQKWGKVYIPHASMDTFQKEAVEAAEKEVNRVCEKHFPGYPKLKKRVVSGDPADEILKVIESEDVDLVIIGTHGRKGLEHIIFGSVAENVVKKSAVPVLTINPYKVE